ncbi:kinase-like domain-containing protein [Gigaspora rosea]|uniref:Kinase-like domain-containing protein n=1 Tax=Gigaspora rosea TaxID=44941 RepID=A0A397W053_9GLOM|nr:kinase-like domain-containing protein [Gigaspora rosea]
MSSLKNWFNSAISGEEFNEVQYDDLREFVFIDRGAFGEVYSANYVSIRNTVAVKKVFQSYLEKQDVFDAFIKELKLHIKLGDNSRIIKFLGVSKDPNDGSYLIVMEYADSGCLQQFLIKEKDNLQWIEKLSLARQLTEGVAYIHGKNIVHRDLHNKNILIHQRQIKIADFGLSKNLNSTLTTQSPLLGILPYIEPIAIANYGYKKDKRSDIYSIGVLLWEISSCRSPFDGIRDQTAVYTCILQGAREAPISKTPVKYMELYKRCWETEPDLRPNIDEIVVRLNSMRLEPVYCPPSQMPVNSRSFNALLSSIRHNPTLIFDENLAVPLKSIDEIPPDYGTCKCGCKFTNVEWCKECESKKFYRNFLTWTSGNQQLDELIRESQLEATHVSHYIEWIGRDQLVNIEMIAGGGFSTVSSAIWRDGPREEWDEETSQWERAFNTKVAVRSISNKSDISSLLKEVKLHLYCDKVIRCYGVTFAGSPYDDNYGLVLKYASYGDLRSFINKRSFVGWWQKLKILEGIIQGLNQIHLKAGYIHRDLHSGNILIDQDELSVSVLGAYISDFGLSTSIDSDVTEAYGVLPYVAPEVFIQQPYTPSIDIYSFGVIMSELTTESVPFYDREFDEQLAIDICGGLRPNIGVGTPKCYVDVMTRCWEADPLKRPSSTELLSIITAWNNRSRDENQFNSADRKVRGLKKRRRAKNTQQLASRLLNFSELINFSELTSAKYTTIEYNFDKDNLLSLE